MADQTPFIFGEANFDVVNVFTRDTTIATGTQAVTGLGFTPQVIIFFAGEDTASEASWGMDDGSSYLVMADYFNAGANQYDFHNGYSILDWEGGAALYKGKIQSFDSDGFTVTWIRDGAPSGTLEVQYGAYA